MKLTLESTTKKVTLIIGGAEVPARIWQGHTAAGVPCHVYITRVAVEPKFDQSEFQRDLNEHVPPRADVLTVPARFVI